MMTSSKRIMVTGNREVGLAAAIGRRVKADFFSRTNGFDLSREEKRAELANLSLEYDVFVNCASLWRFQQLLLLEEIVRCWSKAGHKGYIIVIGSSADYTVKPTEWIYPIEKKALKAYCRNLSLKTLGSPDGQTPPSGVRITYLSPGYLHTPEIDEKYPNVRKLDTDYVAGLISWLIDQPERYNISELALDPIQVKE